MQDALGADPVVQHQTFSTRVPPCVKYACSSGCVKATSSPSLLRRSVSGLLQNQPCPGRVEEKYSFIPN